MSITITFHGACGTVTGSCFEVRNSRGGILIDCGMFQGTKTVKALNYEPFPFMPKRIAALVLTHAHVDHCGLVPRLVAEGFSGPVVTTAATADLASYVLPDSGHIQEIEVERLNRRNAERGRPDVAPIYTRADAERSLSRFKPADIGTWVQVSPGMRARFWDAGHILGAVSVELEVSENGKAGDALRLVFSGDIGPGTTDFHGQPQAPAGIDYLIMESTYGDRPRSSVTIAERRQRLAQEIAPTLAAHGLLLIPAFAVERTQELLMDLGHLFATRTLGPIQIFVDSPLANRATEVFAKHLDGAEGKFLSKPPPYLHFVDDVAESRKLNRISGGAIIIAGSGMCDAGRIRHHMKAHLAQPATTVLLVGYQAPGTLGRLLMDGASMVRIQGEEVSVAARIRHLDQYSGHADQQGLLAWAQARRPVAHEIMLVHGEDPARKVLRDLLVQSGFTQARIKLPVSGETMRLTAHGAVTAGVKGRLPTGAALRSDWHNQFAANVLALRSRLEKAPNDTARMQLLERVGAALKE